MNILWSPEAIGDLNSLRAYIAQDNPSAARGVVLQIMHLPYNPQMGAPAAYQAHVSSSSPRRLSSSPIDCSEIHQILRVYDGARRWPESL